jgi:uncharacterized protein with GYD domain
MPIFVTQGRYARDALKGMLAKPEDRFEAAAKLAQAAGGKLLSYYVTFGEYDWLVVTEMPNEQQAAAFVLTAAAGGGVTDVRTMLAMTTAQAKQAFTAAGDMTADYRPPGAA